jgi:hypothetical protein
MTNTATQWGNPRWIAFFRYSSILLLAVVLIVYLLSTPPNFLNFRDSERWGLGYATALEQIGLSRDLYALYFVIWQTLPVSTSFILAFIILARKTQELLAITVAVMISMSVTSVQPTFYTTFPEFGAINLFIANLMLVLVMLTFPNGRFFPRYSWLILIANIPFQVIYVQENTYSWVNDLSRSTPLVITSQYILLGVLVAVQAYRYFKISNNTQKQQTRWVLLGFIALMLGLFVFVVPSIIFPAARFPSSFISNTIYDVPSLLSSMIIIPILQIGLTAVPLAFTISIIRYRLWDLNLVINNSLVIGFVTLWLIFLFSIVFLILHGMLGFLNLPAEAELIISGLAIGISFNPIRERVRDFVDRKIFRFAFNLDQAKRGQIRPQLEQTGEFTGRVIDGYKLEGVLGRGGMGEVYYAENDNLAVAIKVLPSHFSKDANFTKRFAMEAQALKNLPHPHIVHFHETGVQDNLNYLVLEYLQGETLSEYLKKHSQTDWQTVIRWMIPIGEALHFAHQQGIVHRDVKPSNIMLCHTETSNEYQPKIMDFGVAQVSDATRLTGSGAIGTLDYMAPEQIIAAREVDHRADQYAFGVILYETIVGVRPFTGTTAQVIFAHLQQPVKPPHQSGVKIPDSLEFAILRTLEKNAINRYANMLELVNALKSLSP